MKRVSPWIGMAFLAAWAVAGCGGDSATKESNEKPTEIAGDSVQPDKAAPSADAVSPDTPVSSPAEKTTETVTPPPATGGLVLRFDFSKNPVTRYRVEDDLYIVEGTERSPQAQQRTSKTSMVVVETVRADGDKLIASSSIQNPTAKVYTNNKLDEPSTKSFIEQLNGRTNSQTFDRRGMVAEAADIDVGYGGIVFPEKAVAVGSKWDYSTNINIGSLVGGDELRLPVKARYHLLEMKGNLAHIVMLMETPVNANGRNGAHFEGKFRLAVDAWLEAKTGVATSGTTKLDTTLSAAKGGSTIHYVRQATERRKKL